MLHSERTLFRSHGESRCFRFESGAFGVRVKVGAFVARAKGPALASKVCPIITHSGQPLLSRSCRKQALSRCERKHVFPRRNHRSVARASGAFALMPKQDAFALRAKVAERRAWARVGRFARMVKVSNAFGAMQKVYLARTHTGANETPLIFCGFFVWGGNFVGVVSLWWC